MQAHCCVEFNWVGRVHIVRGIWIFVRDVAVRELSVSPLDFLGLVTFLAGLS